MAKTFIEWATHTFNGWWGCEVVSEACKNCYAMNLAPRFSRQLFAITEDLWGKDAPRPISSDKVWAQPLAWERTAIRTGVRPRIFSLSMGDVFEDRRDLDAPRERLFWLIEATPHCDWLLLTKRPQHVGKLIPQRWTSQGWPPNVWLGTTVENQKRADERIPHLIQHPAAVRFLSVEPQLGEIDLRPYLSELDWIINGGESGSRARATPIEWIRSIREQALAARVPYFFKQWGRHAQRDGQGNQLVQLGKKDFRVLDGRTWDEFPTPKVRIPTVPATPSVWQRLRNDDEPQGPTLASTTPVQRVEPDDDAHVQAWLASQRPEGDWLWLVGAA